MYSIPLDKKYLIQVKDLQFEKRRCHRMQQNVSKTNVTDNSKNFPFRTNRAKVLDFSYHITWSHTHPNTHIQPYVILQIHKCTCLFSLC